MRNYVSLFRGDITWYSGGVLSLGPSPWFGLDLDQWTQSANSYATYEMSQGVGDSYTLAPVCFQYIEIDKFNLLQVVKYATEVAPGVWRGWNGVYGNNGLVDGLPIITQSPRATGWRDAAGVTRPAPPSESGKAVTNQRIIQNFTGATTLYEAYLALPELAKYFQQQGMDRDSGIVLYAYYQVKAGTWSITRAFDYIAENITS